MRSLSVILLSSIFATTIVACGSKERVNASSATASYDVVSEGDASGVAATINGPGEVTPPAMTATNADTTTNLAITGQPAPPTATDGNLAGALPTTNVTPAPVYIPPSNPPIGVMRRTPSPPPATVPRAVPTETAPPITKLPRTQPQPVPPTDTAAQPPTTNPPPTDTSQTDTSRTDTSQQQAPPPAKKKDEPPPPPPPPPDDTDTTSTNPG